MGAFFAVSNPIPESQLLHLPHTLRPNTRNGTLTFVKDRGTGMARTDDLVRHPQVKDSSNARGGAVEGSGVTLPAMSAGVATRVSDVRETRSSAEPGGNRIPSEGLAIASRLRP